MNRKQKAEHSEINVARVIEREAQKRRAALREKFLAAKEAKKLAERNAAIATKRAKGLAHYQRTMAKNKRA